MKKALPWLLVVLGVVGIWLSVDLAGKHFQLVHQPQIEFDSLCEVNATISCSKVNASKYSSFALGGDRAELPVSIPGIGFFAMVLLLGAMAGFSDEVRRQRIFALVALATIPALAFSLWLVFAQAVLIKAWCLFCLALDATTLATLVAAWMGHGGGFGGITKDLKTLGPGLPLTAALVLFAVSFGSYGSYAGKVANEGQKPMSLADSGNGASGPGDGAAAGDHAGHAHGPGEGHGGSKSDDEEMSPEEREKALTEARTAIAEFKKIWPVVPTKELTVNPFDGIKGSNTPLVTVVEFADFECPHCKLAGYFLKDIAHRYGDQVQFVFKHYPLGKSCNEGLSRDVHPDACQAAIATQCARRQGQFWPFHDQTFDSQGNLGTRSMMKISDSVGLDRLRFEECLNNTAVLDEVKTQIAQGRQVGITGTPSIFINGKPLESVHPLMIEAAIRTELTKAGAGMLPADPDGLFN